MVDIGAILLLSGHLICMNVASAGPLLCVAILRPSKQDVYERATQIAGQLAWWSLGLLLLGIFLGVALGFLSWATADRMLVQTLPLFGKKILWGVLEIMCSVGWIWGYWFWLRRRPPHSLIAKCLHGGLALLSASNLLYHFPPLLTVMTQAATGEIAVTNAVDAATFRRLTFTANVMAHSLHFWLASAAVSCAFLFWLVRDLERPAPYFALGGRIALGATLLQIPSGLWLLLVSPPAPQARLLGGQTVATGLFVAGLFCVFMLLQRLATLAVGETNRRHALACARWMAVTVLLMTGALHYLRG